MWDENRLFERAAAVVDRAPARAPAPLPAAPPAAAPIRPAQAAVVHPVVDDRDAQIQRTAQHLREHHECDHERFQCVREGGADFECEVCSEVYYNWIYQCRQCLMIACNKCRHNRV